MCQSSLCDFYGSWSYNRLGSIGNYSRESLQATKFKFTVPRISNRKVLNQNYIMRQFIKEVLFAAVILKFASHME